MRTLNNFDIESNACKIIVKSTGKHHIDIHLTSSIDTKYHLFCDCKYHRYSEKSRNFQRNN